MSFKPWILPFLTGTMACKFILFLKWIRITAGVWKDVCSGVLHDVVEDTSATLEDVYTSFGDDIGALVEGHTEKHKKNPWEKRKEEALAHLAKADAREQKLVLADKLANMRAIARDDAKYGEDLWQRFKRGKDIQS